MQKMKVTRYGGVSKIICGQSLKGFNDVFNSGDTVQWSSKTISGNFNEISIVQICGKSLFRVTHDGRENRRTNQVQCFFMNMIQNSKERFIDLVYGLCP